MKDTQNVVVRGGTGDRGGVSQWADLMGRNQECVPEEIASGSKDKGEGCREEMGKWKELEQANELPRSFVSLTISSLFRLLLFFC
jgi:hypothetical protein